MRCKQIKSLISSNERLSDPQGAHVANCLSCTEHVEFTRRIETQIKDLRIQAPRHLRAAVLEHSAPHRQTISVAHLGLAAAILAIVILPLEPLIAGKFARHGPVNGKIGSWPTYHSVLTRYQILSNGDIPRGGIEGVNEDWVRPDSARSITTSGKFLDKDILIIDENGLPIKVERVPGGGLTHIPDGNGYYYSPEGKVRQDPAACHSFSPFTSDLRWQVDIPSDFSKLSTTVNLDTLPLSSGGSIPVNRVTMFSSSREAKVIAYEDKLSGQVLYLDHYTTVRDQHGRIVANLERDFSMTFDYAAPSPDHFDPGSLKLSAMSTPARQIAEPRNP